METTANAQGYSQSLQAGGGFAFTPDNDNDITDSEGNAVVAKGLRVEGGGDGKTLKVTFANDEVCAFTDVETGYHPLIVKRIWATGTNVTKVFVLR